MLLKIAFVLPIAWLLGVVGLNRFGDLVPVTPSSRPDAPPPGGAQGSRRCRSSWKGCRLKQIMTTRSTSVGFRWSVSR